MSATFTVWAVYATKKNPSPFITVITRAQAVRVAVITFDKPIEITKILAWRNAISDMFIESYPKLEVHCEPYSPLRRHQYRDVEYISPDE